MTVHSMHVGCTKVLEHDVLRALDGADDEGHAVEDDGQEEEDGEPPGKFAAFHVCVCGMCGRVECLYRSRSSSVHHVLSTQWPIKDANTQLHSFAFTTTDLERGSSKDRKRTMRRAVSLSFHCRDRQFLKV